MMNSTQLDNQANQFVRNPFILKQPEQRIEEKFTIASRKDISQVINETKKSKNKALTLDVRMNSLPYPYFQQLLKFLKQISKSKKMDNIEVNWYFNPKNFDLADKGRLLASFCPDIHFHFNKLGMSA